MSKTKKRIYNSPERQERAAQTKQRILTSAKHLFEDKGFEIVTLEQIAQKAKVATPTIYALFQSKRGILRALMDQVFPPEEHAALVERGKKKKTPQEQLPFAAKIARKLYDAERAQMELFRGASVLSPEFKELEKEREQRRHVRLKDSIEQLAAENALAKDLSKAKALDILWAMTGRDIYRMLVIEQGWSSQAYETWLAEALIKLLLG